LIQLEGLMKKEEAYETLRLRIVANRLTPGEILNEKGLMATLDIGRSPLREVLFRLQEENLIKPLPRLGYMVTTLDLSEMRELIELRRELEGFAGQLAAQRINHQQLAQLRTIIREAEQVPPDNAKINKISDYFDTRFHKLLYAATGNRKLAKVLQNLHIVMLRIWYHVGLDAIGFSKQARNLYAVLDALEARHPERARAAMQDHVSLYAIQIKEKIL
jgi:DNA-binding GntR family transcriptional regulator